MNDAPFDWGSFSVFIGLVSAVCAANAGYSLYRRSQNKKRTVAMGAVAQTLGLGFEQEGDAGSVGALSLSTAIFVRGSGGRLRNIKTGTFDGNDVAVFDYRYTDRYTTSNVKETGDWNQTVAVG